MSTKLSQPVRDIWTDMYKLHETFDAMGSSVDDWALWWKTSMSILHKHNDHPLCEQLILGLTAYLEEVRKQAEKEESECKEGASQGGKEIGGLSSQDSQNESKAPSQLGMF